MKKLLALTTALFLMANSVFAAQAGSDRSGLTVKMVSGYTITSGGSGGTNGTFAITGLGTGTCTTAPVGTFTVAGGAVTSLKFTTQGVCTVAPTPTFTNSAGLASTNITLSLDNLYNAFGQNTYRSAFYIFNPNAAHDCWGRFSVDTINLPASPNAAGSFKITALTGIMMPVNPAREALSIQCSTVGDAVTAFEITGS